VLGKLVNSDGPAELNSRAAELVPFIGLAAANRVSVVVRTLYQVDKLTDRGRRHKYFAISRVTV